MEATTGAALGGVLGLLIVAVPTLANSRKPNGSSRIMPLASIDPKRSDDDCECYGGLLIIKRPVEGI